MGWTILEPWKNQDRFRKDIKDGVFRLTDGNSKCVANILNIPHGWVKDILSTNNLEIIGYIQTVLEMEVKQEDMLPWTQEDYFKEQLRESSENLIQSMRKTGNDDRNPTKEEEDVNRTLVVEEIDVRDRQEMNNQGIKDIQGKWEIENWISRYK